MLVPKLLLVCVLVVSVYSWSPKSQSQPNPQNPPKAPPPKTKPPPPPPKPSPSPKPPPPKPSPSPKPPPPKPSPSPKPPPPKPSPSPKPPPPKPSPSPKPPPPKPSPSPKPPAPKPGPPQTKLQPANGSFNFVYAQEGTREAAMAITTINTKAEKFLKSYLEGLNTSNQAATLYKTYEAAAADVEGTPCELSKDDKLSMGGFLEDINDSVDVCIQSVSYKGFDTLKQAVTDDLIKIQNLDNNMTVNVQRCLSGFYSQSYCKQIVDQDKSNLKEVASQEELSRLLQMTIDVVGDAMKEVDQCVDEDTSCTVDDINDALDMLSSCKEGKM